MERRTKLILLIIAALILLAIGVYILLQPFLPSIVPAQPPALTTTPPTTTITTTVPPVTATPAAPVVPQDIKKLEDLATIVVSRIGSGSSVDGFTGYDDVLLDATPSERVTLKSEQAALQKDHPPTGPSFGMVTRVVSVDSSGAVSGAQTIAITLQAQRAEDAGNPTQPTSVTYKKATVTFEKQSDGTYLVNGVMWEDIAR